MTDKHSWLSGLPDDIAEYVQQHLDSTCLTCPARQAPDMMDICQSCPIQGIYERAADLERAQGNPCLWDPWAPENWEALINSGLG